MKPLDEVSLDDLIYRFNRGDPEQVDAAAARLRELTDEALRALVDRLRVDPNSTTVPDMSAVNAVIAIGPRVVPALLAAIEQRGLDGHTGYALIHLGVRRAIPIFTRELETPGAKYRELAAEALGQLGASEEIPRLRALLDDDDAAVADSAAGSLGQLGDVQSVEAIARVAHRCDLDMVSAVYGLGRLDHPVARDTLLGLLSHADLSVRVAAIDAIGRARQRSAIPALLEMIDAADGIELEELLIALADLPDRSAVPQLRKIVETRPDCAVPYGPVLAELAAAALRAIENSGPPY
jgi:HEAT repeat protein